jgi:putative addiction module antidote
MDQKVTLTDAGGGSVAVILPRTVAERLGLRPGDTLFVRDTPDGVELTKTDPEFARQMAAATHIMDDDRDALGRLARLPRPSRRGSATTW